MRHHAIAATMGFAAAVLFSSASQSQAASVDPVGYWMKPDAERESKIQVFKCGSSKKLLCAKIAWLKDPHDSKGKPLVDVRNENPSLRGRQIVGLTIFTGLTPSAPSTWTGKIYNPEDGKTYSATLTVLSRSKILLKGCKAWLLCGERYWLRTAAPEELQPTAPAEGTEQIEASVTPSAPEAPKAVAEAKPEPVEAEAPGLPERAPEAPQAEIAAVAAPAAPAEAQEEIAALAAPAAPAEAQPAQPGATPVALVTRAAAATAPAAEYNWRKGYGFLNLATEPQPAKLSGENVPSMFVMAEPIAADQGKPAAAAGGDATAALAPTPKPKAKPKPMIAAAAAKPSPKPAASPKPASQAAPAPQEGEAGEATTTADNSEGQTAEAAMVDESTLTRRQKRLLRRQQMQQEPFLPWLR